MQARQDPGRVVVVVRYEYQCLNRARNDGMLNPLELVPKRGISLPLPYDLYSLGPDRVESEDDLMLSEEQWRSARIQ